MTDRYYDEIAAGYDELHGEEQLAKYRRVRELLGLTGAEETLDVGAGTGIGASVIPSVGLDPSPALLAYHPDERSVVGRAEALPFPDKSFDLATCVTAIHHADARQAITEMRRVSRSMVAVTVLKKARDAASILAACNDLLPGCTVVEDDKDWIVVWRAKA